MIKSSIINDNELLKLEKKFRKGLIKEEDLSSEELRQLKELYKKQIEYMDNSIEEDKKEILSLKSIIRKKFDYKLSNYI